jgi:isopropylmalate/homocitrate/citramalate synthase
MTTTSKIWVSELNARAEVRNGFPRETVRFYDTTLRDGEQTVGVVLSPQQKVEIARKLDELGISRIEAGFPRVSPEDAEAIQLLQKAGIRAELWGFSRAVKADVDELVRLGLRASVIESPTSEIKL